MSCGFFRWFLGFSLFLALASGAGAQSLFDSDKDEDGRGWEAVGRIEIAGKAFCTGALITPEIVVTAAHCLIDAKSGEPVPNDKIKFLAGWSNGRASAYRLVKRTVLHPKFSFGSGTDAERVRHDLALIELQHPIRNERIAPFAIDRAPQSGDRVGVVSYAHNRSEAPALQDTCNVIARQEGMVVLSCSVDFGASGSPVFVIAEDGQPRIVSIVSSKAQANGAPVALATRIEGALKPLQDELAQQRDPDNRHARLATDPRQGSGAGFVRP